MQGQAACVLFLVLFSFLSNIDEISANHQSQENLENDNHHPVNKEEKLIISKDDISNPMSLDAIARAKSDQCRQQMIETAYWMEHNASMVHPLSLPRTCPLATPSKFLQYVGCYANHRKDPLLKKDAFMLRETNSVENCVHHCVRAGQELAALTKTAPLRKENGLCKAYPCPGNESEFCGGHKVMAIYETGVGKSYPVLINHIGDHENIQGPQVKIAFFLAFSGRATRQIRRMIKLIYRRKHFYYVHVDARHSLLYREMLDLEKVLPNFKVKRNRFPTIWGGASFLKMTLDSLKDLLDGFSDWNWDYVINLSESDMPLVSVDVLERVLRKYRGTNFHYSLYSMLKNNNLNYIFVECDQHMYRMGRRQLPNGIRCDAGSEWYALHRPLVEFALSNDELAVGLRRMFETVVYPGDSFFHVLALNSHFCTTMANNNFRLVNWKYDRGCKCRDIHIIDWCGCSPNILVMDDLDRLKQPAVLKTMTYFARKFDAIIDQSIIRRIETQVHEQEASSKFSRADDCVADKKIDSTTIPIRSVYGPDHNSLYSYWENRYDILDQSMDDLRTSDFPTWSLLRSLARLTLKRFLPKMESKCKMESVQRLHIYQVTDVFQGLLVQFNGTCSSEESRSERPWSLEAFVQKSSHVNKIMDSDPLLKALIDLEVGTQFDPKEEIFRNYAGAMTTDGEIVIRHEWDVQILSEINGDKNVTLLVLDPDGKNQGWYTQALQNPRGVEATRLFVSKQKMEPGVWKVQLLVQECIVIAERSFLLLPVDNDQEEPWPRMDDLISRFYHIEDICKAYHSSMIKPDKCEKGDSFVDLDQKEKANSLEFQECKDTFWSSLSPDPKSEIHGIDWKGYATPSIALH